MNRSMIFLLAEFFGLYWRFEMSDVTGLKQALVRETSKLVRQEDALVATQAMIALIEGQIKIAEAKK